MVKEPYRLGGLLLGELKGRVLERGWGKGREREREEERKRVRTSF
jgi:hypothetical protein